jgi:S1-C subfamily serine protease
MFRKFTILFLISTISFSKATSQLKTDIYCFKIDSYKIYGKKNNNLTLSYSSILRGNITISVENGKYTLLKSGASELMIDELPNGKIMFYNVYNATNYKTIINSSEIEKNDFEIILEDETTLIKYNFVRIRSEASIYSSISSGTCFFIDSTHLLTNYHVVDGGG